MSAAQDPGQQDQRVGLREEALDAAREAAGTYRSLAKARPDAFPDR
jgi:hypothetical protein